MPGENYRIKHPAQCENCVHVMSLPEFNSSTTFYCKVHTPTPPCSIDRANKEWKEWAKLNKVKPNGICDDWRKK